MVSTASRAKRMLKSCKSTLVTLGKSTIRLLCLIGFIAGAIVLFLLFTAVAVQRNSAVAEDSVDVGRRLVTSESEFGEWPLAMDASQASSVFVEPARRLNLPGAEAWPWASTCWEYGVHYGSATVWAIPDVMELDFCQKLCRNHTGCSHVTYTPDDSLCDLKANDFGRRYHTNGISGPAFCPGYPTPAPENETMVIDIGCNPTGGLMQRMGTVDTFDWYHYLNITNTSRVADLMNGSQFPQWLAGSARVAYSVASRGKCVDTDGAEVKFIFTQEQVAPADCKHECNVRATCEGYASDPLAETCFLYGKGIQDAEHLLRNPPLDDYQGQLVAVETVIEGPVFEFATNSGRSTVPIAGGSEADLNADAKSLSCYIRDATLNASANITSWLNLTELDVNGSLGVPLCGDLNTRRRREKNSGSNNDLLTEFDGKAEWNCTNQTWCEQNITDENGRWLLANCYAMEGSVSLCGACPGCMQPCPTPPTTTTTTPRPLHPAAVAWAFVPVEQMMVRFCNIDAPAPICIFMLLYLFRCYACSLISSISHSQNLRKDERVRMEQRKRSREMGITVEEMQSQKKKRKRKTSTGEFVVDRPRVVEIEPPPPSKGKVKGGRIFGV